MMSLDFSTPSTRRREAFEENFRFRNSQRGSCAGGLLMMEPSSSSAFESIRSPLQREDGIVLRRYSELDDLRPIISMMERDLSEPYSIFTYRYFVNDWPDLAWLAVDGDKIIGSVVCEIKERKGKRRGYIAMLSVDPDYRRRGIAQDLVIQCLRIMREAECQMAMLETEVINDKATNLYTKLGFQKDKYLIRYYLNGGDAWRLKLFFNQAK